MPTVLRCRHIGYTSAGIPIVRVLPSLSCYDNGLIDSVLGGRQIAWTGIGFPILATTLACCYAVNDCTPKVETDCLPNGLDHTMVVQAFEVSNCPSARDFTPVKLQYCAQSASGSGDCAIGACTSDPNPDPLCHCTVDASRGKWVGDITLAGGNLHLEVCCTPGSPNSYRLSYSGCVDGCMDVQADCDDPLKLTFPMIVSDDCCDCQGSATAEFNIEIRANCRATVTARHIDYTSNGIPVFAVNNCGGDTAQSDCLPQCDLTMTVSNVSGCACLAGTYTLPYDSGFSTWVNSAVGACTSPATFSFACTPGDTTGTIDLVLNVTCGVDTTGTSQTITINSEDLNTLDETFTAVLTDPTAGGCTGLCRWVYNAMSGSWEEQGSTCSAECDACPNQPANPPASPSDGEVWTEACTGSAAPDCCVGTISVRIMR